MICFILLSSYTLHLYVFVLICQYHVVLRERTNNDIIYYLSGIVDFKCFGSSTL